MGRVTLVLAAGFGAAVSMLATRHYPVLRRMWVRASAKTSFIPPPPPQKASSPVLNVAGASRYNFCELPCRSKLHSASY